MAKTSSIKVTALRDLGEALAEAPAAPLRWRQAREWRALQARAESLTGGSARHRQVVAERVKLIAQIGADMGLCLRGPMSQSERKETVEACLEEALDSAPKRTFTWGATTITWVSYYEALEVLRDKVLRTPANCWI